MDKPAPSPDRSLLDRPWEDLPGDVQSRLAVACFAWIVIGTIVEVMYYREFGILIGPFKRSEVFLFLLLAFSATFLALQFVMFMQKCFPNICNITN